MAMLFDHMSGLKDTNRLLHIPANHHLLNELLTRVNISINLIG